MMPRHHHLGSPAELRARESEARIERGADGSRYSSARRTALHRQRNSEVFDPHDDSDAFAPWPIDFTIPPGSGAAPGSA